MEVLSPGKLHPNWQEEHTCPFCRARLRVTRKDLYTDRNSCMGDSWDTVACDCEHCGAEIIIDNGSEGSRRKGADLRTWGDLPKKKDVKHPPKSPGYHPPGSFEEDFF